VILILYIHIRQRRTQRVNTTEQLEFGQEYVERYDDLLTALAEAVAEASGTADRRGFEFLRQSVSVIFVHGRVLLHQAEGTMGRC
jgi:hypothetical protein